MFGLELNEIEQHLEANAPQITEQIENFVNENKKLMDGVTKNAGNILQQTEADIEQSLILGTENQEEINKKLDGMVDRVQEKLSPYEQTVTAMLLKLITDQNEQIAKNNETIAKLNETVERLNRPFTEKVKDAAAAIKEGASNAMHSASNAMHSVTQAVIGFVKDAGNAIKDFTLGTLDACKNAAKTMKDNVAKFFDEKVKQPIRDTVQNMRDAVDRAKVTMEHVKEQAHKAIVVAKDKTLDVLTFPLRKVLEADAKIREETAARLQNQAGFEKDLVERLETFGRG